MSRLIDADALKDAIKTDIMGGLNYRRFIDDAPTVDAVPVVRCKDCKYGEIDDPDFPDQYLCNHHGSDWNPGDHFCSYGEKVTE